MRVLLHAAVLCAALWAAAARAETAILCTIVEDAATGVRLIDQGDCDQRVTPASTFKIAIALMGFDSGILVDADHPELPFKEGYVDWRPQWRVATTPTTWIRNSVVWYSQQVTQALGMGELQAYLAAFDYGNLDASGQPGDNDGLTNAWLSSSLQVSPNEQVAFLRRLVNRDLGVSDFAYTETAAITDLGIQPSGWRVHGKTGSGAPLDENGEMMMGRGYGWFVGWAERDGRTLVFARLIQYSERQTTSPGVAARESVLADLFTAPQTLD